MRLRPNLTCVVTPLEGWDEYGSEKFGTPREERCGVVKLNSYTEPTSVRADSSATRAYADELKAQSRLLFPNSSTIKQGDKVELQSLALRVVSVWPRHDVGGEFDHWQVDLTVWGNG